MQRTFKTRLKVNDVESNILAQWCGVSRLAYNVCLDQWNRDYENGVKHNYYSIKKWFNSVKREMFPFITGVSKWVPEAAIKDLDTAFRNMYRHTAKHPRFHKKGVRDSFRIDGSVIAVSGKNLKLPKGLCLRLMERFRYENQVNKINNATISRKAGYWFASISCDVGDPARENQGAGVLGVDVGVKSLAVCSDGTVIDNPKTLYRREKRKKHLQRMVARKQKGSNNQRKAKALLARYEYRTAVKREDWLHKASSRIARANRGMLHGGSQRQGHALQPSSREGRLRLLVQRTAPSARIQDHGARNRPMVSEQPAVFQLRQPETHASVRTRLPVRTMRHGHGP